MMTATDVTDVMARLLAAGVKAWLDGGWGVDALLGEQTREHEDLDLVVELSAVDQIIGALADLEYRIAEDLRPVRLVIATPDGRSIDLHTVTFDEGGGGVQPQPGGGSFRYPPEGFTARGVVGGVDLPCLSPEVQVLCHTGYEPTDTDRQDMRLLAERFGVQPPEAYR
jgi:lincosamide nucleotidyltransferase A/C/D/E